MTEIRLDAVSEETVRFIANHPGFRGFSFLDVHKTCLKINPDGSGELRFYKFRGTRDGSGDVTVRMDPYELPPSHVRSYLVEAVAGLEQCLSDCKTSLAQLQSTNPPEEG